MDHFFNSGIIITVVVGSFVSLLYAINLRIGSKRNAKDALVKRPDKLASFTTGYTMHEILPIVERYATEAGMQLEEADMSAGRIVLGQNSQGWHNGIWLPIYVTERPGVPTLLEVGIKSKTYQAGFALILIRDKIVKELQARMHVV